MGSSNSAVTGFSPLESANINTRSQNTSIEIVSPFLNVHLILNCFAHSGGVSPTDALFTRGNFFAIAKISSRPLRVRSATLACLSETVENNSTFAAVVIIERTRPSTCCALLLLQPQELITAIAKSSVLVCFRNSRHIMAQFIYGSLNTVGLLDRETITMLTSTRANRCWHCLQPLRPQPPPLRQLLS